MKSSSQTPKDGYGQEKTIYSHGIRLKAKDLSTTRSTTLKITGMTSDYILLCIPSRITDPASFWDNSTGFGADFESSVTVSVINQYGYTENYDVFRSTNTVTGDFTLETK